MRKLDSAVAARFLTTLILKRAEFNKESGTRTATQVDLRYNPSVEVIVLGGPGSGHHGHAGRPGQVGGSADGDGGGSTAKSVDPEDFSHPFSSYVGEGSQETNRALRNGRKPDGIEKIDALMRPSQKEMDVYRLTEASVFNGLQAGDVIDDEGFVSTTSNPNALARIAEDVGALDPDEGLVAETAVLIIRAPSGTKMIDVNSVFNKEHDYYHQREHILARGTRFRVRKIEKNTKVGSLSGVTAIHLMVVK